MCPYNYSLFPMLALLFKGDLRHPWCEDKIGCNFFLIPHIKLLKCSSLQELFWPGEAVEWSLYSAHCYVVTSYSGFHIHIIGQWAIINISKCIITGRIVLLVELTPFSAALKEDWLAPAISSLTFAWCMCTSYLVHIILIQRDLQLPPETACGLPSSLPQGINFHECETHCMASDNNVQVNSNVHSPIPQPLRKEMGV